MNLRFFFGSPQYSEDMDIDIHSIHSDTLRKNCYKILNDPGFRRSLSSYGSADILINDPTKSKQTQTTQRFRVRLLTSQGLELPTKVEFSRREPSLETVHEIISPEIARVYFRLSFKCQHYSGLSAAIQKVEALAGRTETQARDVFDLYLLYLGGLWKRGSFEYLDQTLKKQAVSNLETITFEQYRDQVEEYLSPPEKIKYSGASEWLSIQKAVVENIK